MNKQFIVLKDLNGKPLQIFDVRVFTKPAEIERHL